MVSEAEVDDAARSERKPVERRPAYRHPVEGAAPGAGMATLVRGRVATQNLSVVELLLVGAMAGAIAKTATAPLERLQTVYQVNPKTEFTHRGAFRLAADFVRVDGVLGLWRGHFVTLMRVVPFAGVQFLVYGESLDYLRDGGFFTLLGVADERMMFALSPVFAGALAAISATVMTYPLDVIRTRMRVSGAVGTGHMLASLEDLAKIEGSRGFYRGIFPTLLGIVPYAALSFSTFEAMKKRLRRSNCVATDSEVPILQRLAAGTASGLLAQMVVYPLHLVRRRMQLKGAPEFAAQGSLSYSSTRELFMQIHAMEGMKGFFRGASISFIKGPMTLGIAFVANDVLKGIMRKLDEGDQHAPLPGRGHHVAGAAGSTDSNSRKTKAIESLVAGGVAGALAKTVIAPADRIKIIFQTDPAKTFNWSSAWRLASGIVEERGFRSLWRGHAATLARVVPYSATSFATFEPYKGYVRSALPPDYSGDVLVRFLAGAAAGSTATTLTYPLDMMRARMAARGNEEAYQSYSKAMREVVRTEGPRSLFAGLRPTLVGIVPYSGISFCLFETLKAELKVRQGLESDSDLGVFSRLGAGAVAGLTAQSVTYPLDVVRRRMQVYPGQYRGITHALYRIGKDEGWRGLFKGLSMNWVKGPLAIGLSFAVNDKLRAMLPHFNGSAAQH